MEYDVVEKSDRWKNVVLFILISLLVIIFGMGVYFWVFKPKDTGKNGNDTTPTVKILTKDEALVVVKDRVLSANNFFGNFKSSSECTDMIEDMYCYYDTVGNFNSKFYSIYSKSLTYLDVFNDSREGTPRLKISDNKAYVFNHCTMGSGDKSLKGDYKIRNITSDTISATYVFLDTDPISGSTTDVNAELKLVKEDDSWKVANITLLGICNGIYDVGK